MKCPQCGRELPYGSKYCLFCDINIENDEIPTPTEPTRVIPVVGAPKKKPKLKDEKKRQLIMFYGSVAAIALLIIILFVVIFKACSKPDENLNYSPSEVESASSVESTVSVNSTVSLPFYNSVNTSSATSLEPNATESSSQEQTTLPVTVLPGSNYLSFTVADLKKNFGDISSTESNEGEGSILSFKNCNYKFIVNSASPNDSDRVDSVIVLKGGEIVSGAKVGQTYNEIYNSFDSAFQFSFDEEEEIAVATTSSSNASYYIYFEKEDKNTPSLSALIKLK